MFHCGYIRRAIRNVFAERLNRTDSPVVLPPVGDGNKLSSRKEEQRCRPPGLGGTGTADCSLEIALVTFLHIVENPRAAANHGFLERSICKTGPRRKIISVRRNQAAGRLSAGIYQSFPRLKRQRRISQAADGLPVV